MEIRINNKIIGDGNPALIVAEIGVNHNQDIELAKKTIRAAKESGADAVKFQTWKTENIILKDSEMAEYQKKNLNLVESQYDMLKKLELPYEWHYELKEYAQKLGLLFFSTMEDKESVDFLIKKLKIDFIKVGSGDISNYPLLRHTAKYQIPMIVSTGISTLADVDEAIRIIRGEGNENVIVCQCTSQYPTPHEDINLNAMTTLRKSFKTLVGFSDHSVGIECPIASVALGATYIEKHFTLDKNLPGPDHKASIDPVEFDKMVKAVRLVEKSLGHGRKELMPSEKSTKKAVVRRIVALKDIKKGQILNDENLTFKRTTNGIEAKNYSFIEGAIAKDNIKKDEVITFDKL
ncbi:N-acetylneuraminate synthase [archaeon D22]|nr:N-acetylneuraminate synthase [archaeon D22]